MSKLAAFALPALTVWATACTSFDGYAEIPDAPTTPILTEPMLSAGPTPAIVATGGTQGVTVPQTNVGWSGAASAGFSIAPENHVWPNVQEPIYWIRALAPGDGSFSIRTDLGDAIGTIEAADLARVAVVPADYELDGHSAFALAADRLAVQAQLYDADARRLVDATLAVADQASGAAPQTAWDRATLAAAPGAHDVLVTGDSLAAAAHAAVTVAASAPDRTETVRTGDRACAHAYLGELEIAAAAPPSGGTPDPLATNCATF